MKLIVLGTGVVATTGVSMLLFGAGVAAAADDYAGMTYGDAESAVYDSGKTPDIVTRNGDLSNYDCTVERSQTNSGGDKVLFYLNCTQAVASAGKSGHSAASPEGRAELAKQAEAAAKQKAEEEAARQQSENAELLDTDNAPGTPGN